MAGAVIWLANLFEPLLLGIVLALVLNVPMCPIEKKTVKEKIANPEKYGFYPEFRRISVGFDDRKEHWILLQCIGILV